MNDENKIEEVGEVAEEKENGSTRGTGTRIKGLERYTTKFMIAHELRLDDYRVIKMGNSVFYVNRYGGLSFKAKEDVEADDYLLVLDAARAITFDEYVAAAQEQNFDLVQEYIRQQQEIGDKQ